MPDFLQDSIKPYQKIVVRFNSPEDVKIFSKLLNCNITFLTKSLWFPNKPKTEEFINSDNNRRFIYE